MLISKNWNININLSLPSNIQTEELVLLLNNQDALLKMNKYKLTENDKEILINEKTSNDGVRYCLICRKFKVNKLFI